LDNFLFAALIIIYISYQHKKKYLQEWQREAILLWMINFILCFTFGFIEYHSQWFLLSATIILGPIFKNYKNKQQLMVENN